MPIQDNKLQERHRDHALFVAFAPADDPKIALFAKESAQQFGVANLATIFPYV